jgi:tetratricopeptide (TPR) repeat protein
MKIKLTILFLAVAAIAMAQKKEIRKIEKAIESGNLAEANEIFKLIDENSVETKYLGQYNFYKAAVIIDVSSANPVTIIELREAEKALERSEELGFENNQFKPMLLNSILDKKFTLAAKKVKDKEYDDAILLLREIYEFDTSNQNMLFNLANVEYDAKNYNKSLVDYETLYNQGFTGETITYYAVNTENDQKQVFKSKELRDVAVNTPQFSAPTQESSITFIGDMVTKMTWLYKKEGELDKAKLFFQKSLQKYPDDTSLTLAKPGIYLTLEMMDEYKKELGDETDIKDPLILNNLGDAASKEGKYDQAIQYYLESIKYDDKNAYPRINLANSYIQKGNLGDASNDDKVNLYEKAINELELVHEMDPKNTDVIYGLIGLYEAFGNDEKVSEYKSKL